MLLASLSLTDSSSKRNANELIFVASMVMMAPSSSTALVHSLGFSPWLKVIHRPWIAAGI